MSKSTIRRFDFSITKMDSNSKLPFDPWVVIDLKHWGTTSAGGAPVLSPNLMSEAEIDEHIAALKADLDAVGSKAKRALRTARDQTIGLVTERLNKRASEPHES